MTLYTRNNPTRPTDWRWKRALGVVEQTGCMPSRTTDGAESFHWINRAVRFRRQLNRCQNERDLLGLAESEPEMYWAYRLYMGSTTAELRTKHILEAILLSNADNETAAANVCLLPEGIEAFEQLFFNVRERLRWTHYVFQSVLEPSYSRYLQSQDHYLLWKFFGYVYGIDVLNAIVTKFTNRTRCTNQDQVADVLQDDAISTLKLQAAIAAKTLQITPETQVAILTMFTKFIEVERLTHSGTNSQSQILSHVGGMLEAIDIRMVSKFAPVDPQSPLARYDLSPVELKPTEMLQIQAGGQLAEDYWNHAPIYVQ